ncbi:MAG TPA: hypothetical protein VJV78_07515, partial [Polyangiales bacterium]|nr:hypothetical protein [Polyangiales bacterium]
MTSGNWLCVSGLVCLAALSACSGDPPSDMLMVAAGSGGSPTLTVDNPGSAGKPAAGSGGAGAAGSTPAAADS